MKDWYRLGAGHYTHSSRLGGRWTVRRHFNNSGGPCGWVVLHPTETYPADHPSATVVRTLAEGKAYAEAAEVIELDRLAGRVP